MILVKDFDVMNLDRVLQVILSEVEVQFGPGLYTSAYRPREEGVHGTMPVRGIDRRCRDRTGGLAIVLWVNHQWIYDIDRPYMQCCIYHDTGQGPHLHFQTHPNTTRKEENQDEEH